MNEARMPERRGPDPPVDPAEAGPPDYSGPELLEMARAAGAPEAVLDALDRAAPRSRFRYLAELWRSPSGEARR